MQSIFPVEMVQNDDKSYKGSNTADVLADKNQWILIQWILILWIFLPQNLVLTCTHKKKRALVTLPLTSGILFHHTLN